MAKRVFWIVLDSCGIGYEPDAHEFGDVGADTLRRIHTSAAFSAHHLIALGLSNVDGIDYLEKVDAPLGAYARLRELSRGKDTTIGHWELSGIISPAPLPTYPNGFPRELLEEFSRRVGRGVLCNLPYSGTDVIRDYGEEHLKTGNLIVYTSADSVFQIAAHEDLVPPETLYEYCRIARELLVGEHAVGRVIARPFIGTPGNFKRTANRHDFSLEPPKRTVLDAVCESGKSVISVGKIRDIFVGRGITDSHFTHSNTEGMQKTLEIAKSDFEGLCFTNLVDFDMLYGHRQDIDGYAAALAAFNDFLPTLMAELLPDDILLITADHGCDPGDSSTDHTREYVPLLLYGAKVRPMNLGTLMGFTHVSKIVADALGVSYVPDGNPSLPNDLFIK